MKNIETELAEHYGWSSNPALREKISAAIEFKAERLRVAPEEYCRIAASSFSEMLALVEEVALGETWFFREPHQFNHLRDIIFPNLINSVSQGERAQERVRIWSAACSTGEEAYSLAIAFEQSKPPSQQSQAEVFATDVRNRALMDASQARYHKNSLREVDPQTLERYFERGADAAGQPDETQVVIADVRRLVTFRRVNLFEKAYWKGLPNRFGLIVCSNLLVYMSSAAVRQTVTNLVNSLREGGYLMVAPDEESLVISPQLTQLKDHNSFFQRAG
ncbi:MAG TPA: CheR family methyltransferase [Blastocatellia bacterium]|nr:CheR family methyltransferase [Blastocatellia bacterium]